MRHAIRMRKQMRIVPCLTIGILIALCGNVAAQDYQNIPMDANTRLEQALIDPSPMLVSEATTTYDIYPTPPNAGAPRRNATSNDPFGGEDIGDVPNPKDPGVLPIGDVPVGFFMLLASVCAVVIWCRRTQSPS